MGVSFCYLLQEANKFADMYFFSPPFSFIFFAEKKKANS